MGTLFVTGTDTEVGKTLVAAALLHVLHDSGRGAVGMKPVAAGCEHTEGGLRNADALTLQAAGSVHVPYERLNPHALEPPIAPHIAATQAGVTMDVDEILQAHSRLTGLADWVVVEGAGGWLVPLNDRETLADLATRAAWPVILVVGMRLGCINHALLSAESIRKRTRLAGWVATCPPPQQACLQSNLDTLKQQLAEPCLGVIPELHNPAPEVAASHVDRAVFLSTLAACSA